MGNKTNIDEPKMTVELMWLKSKWQREVEQYYKPILYRKNAIIKELMSERLDLKSKIKQLEQEIKELRGE